METLGKATMTISKSMTMTSTWGEGPGERNLEERGEGPAGEEPGGNPPGGIKFRKSEAANSLLKQCRFPFTQGLEMADPEGRCFPGPGGRGDAASQGAGTA